MYKVHKTTTNNLTRHYPKEVILPKFYTTYRMKNGQLFKNEVRYFTLVITHKFCLNQQIFLSLKLANFKTNIGNET